MGKVMALIGTTIGGGIGWWLGEPAGIMTAFICSMVGTGIGLYAASRFTREYLE